MAKRKRRRAKVAVPTSDYTDPDGNVLTLRRELSPASIAKLAEGPSSRAASAEDAWQRREEATFERLAVRWVLAGLPIDDQRMLLGRYRVASSDERRWVRATIAAHVEEFIPALSGG